MDLGFTDEQRDFAEAIRDFCRRECGTPEQRERLTNGYTEVHSAEIYSKLAELGWLGVTIDEELGGSGGGMVDACIFMEETSRGLAPINGYATTLIVAGRRPAVRLRRAEAGDPRRHRGRLRRGDRDDRARGRLRRRLAHDLRGARQRRLRPQRAEGVLLERPPRRPCAGRMPDDQGPVQARGPDDDLRSHRQPPDGDQADRHARRPRDQPPLPLRLRGARRRRPRRGRPGVDASSWPGSTSSA